MDRRRNIIIAAVGIFLVATAWYVSTDIYSVYGNRIVTVTIGSRNFRAEVVSDEEKMQKGLGKRSGLCRECAMLFRFPRSGAYSFWMKDMRFALDIIWISNGKIVHIEKNVPADFSGILTSSADAGQVLEVNAGISDSSGFKEEDRVILK